LRALVVTNAVPKVSETFILDHARELADDSLVVIRQTSWFERLRRGRDRLVEDPARFAALLHREEIDVVLSEYGPTAVAAMQGCESASVSLVAHFHGFDVSKAAVLAAHRSTYPKLFEYAHRTIAVSEFMKKQLLAIGAPADKIDVIPCGVDTRAFSGADPANSHPRLLMVGRLVEKKDPVLVIRAFAMAAVTNGAAKLVVIGDGPLRAEVEREVSERGLTGRVELKGARGRAEVRTEMLRARAVVQHSRTAGSGDTEGQPVSLMEAASCGLPIVSTRHAGIPELVVDGQTGFLTDEGDETEMTAAMVRLLDDPALAARLGRAGAARARAQFDQGAMHDRLREVLRTAASRR
jgi:glycosyltransferase involved in cell wall biosynthesis